MRGLLLYFLLVTCLSSFATKASTPSKEWVQVAKELYIYGFPVVDNYRIQYSYFEDSNSPDYKGKWNTIHHTPRVYTPEDKALQTPNSDTPYSWLGADLRQEPLVISVPEMPSGRYYSAQFIDQYTYNFAYVGSRTTGQEAGHFLLAGPNWQGEKPNGIKAVIRSETEFAFVVFRTQLFNSADLPEVVRLQQGYFATPLSKFLGQPSPASVPEVKFIKPLNAEASKSSIEFFDQLNFALQTCPPHPSEKAMWERFATLGLGYGKSQFKTSALDAETQAALKKGIEAAWQEFNNFRTEQLETGKRSSSDGFGTRKFLGDDYISRMAAAVLGIYGNSKEEALYPPQYVDSDGQPMSGAHRYTLRFAPGQLPPVKSFWSLTLYELPSSLLYANPIKRYLINSPMLPDLKKDQDGGITLLLQHESPGPELESNWLPTPKGSFWTVMRLYWPEPSAWNGKWNAPVIKKVQ